MKPKVTLGLTLKDCAHTLPEALESIISQDFPHELIEVIFVNDGSKDATSATIKSYIPKIDMDVKVFNQDWHGLGFSRNLIVKNANGKYVIWVDGDMILPPDHVTKQVTFMEKHPRIGIAKAKYGILEKESLVGFLENVSFVAVDKIYGGKTTSRTLGTGGSIYRVETIRQVGGFDTKITGVGEDMDIENRIRGLGWLLFMANDAVFYERRRKSLNLLLREAFWHGLGANYIFRKNRRPLTLLKLSPPAAFLAGGWYATVAYRITRRKTVLILPFYWFLKRVAWCVGFSSGLLRSSEEKRGK